MQVTRCVRPLLVTLSLLVSACAFTEEVVKGTAADLIKEQDRKDREREEREQFCRENPCMEAAFVRTDNAACKSAGLGVENLLAGYDCVRVVCSIENKGADGEAPVQAVMEPENTEAIGSDTRSVRVKAGQIKKAVFEITYPRSAGAATYECNVVDPEGADEDE